MFTGFRAAPAEVSQRSPKVKAIEVSGLVS